MRNRGAVLSAAVMAATACASTPRPFTAEIQPPPADVGAFQHAFQSCAGQVSAGRRENFQSEAIEPGPAAGIGTAAIGTATVGAGLAMGTLSGAAVAISGVALVIASPVLVWAVWRERRADRERIIQKAMTDCLRQRGYEVSHWRRLTDSEMRAGTLGTPTAPGLAPSTNAQEDAPNDRQRIDSEP